MKRETLLTVAVVVLFVLNISTIGFLWFSRGWHPHGPPHGRPPVDGIIINSLNLTTEQQAKFEELKHDHRSQMNKLDGQYRTAITEYLQLLEGDSISAESKSVLEKIVCDIQRQRAEVTLEHFKQLKGICTEEQKKSFDAIIPDLIQVIAPPRHHPPFPPPH